MGRDKPYSVWGVFLAVMKVEPIGFILQYTASVVSSVLLGLFIAQLQNVFDRAAVLVAAPSAETVHALLASLLVLLLYKYGSEGLEIVNGYIGNAYYNRCAAYFLQLYHQEMAQARAIAFEDEDKLTLYRKALEGATAGRGMLHAVMDVFTMYVPYFITIAIYLANQDKGLLAVIILVAAPVLVTNQIKKRHYAQRHESTARPQRRKEEYARYLSDPRYCREIRAGRLFPFFYEKYLNARAEYNKFYVRSARRELMIDLGTKVITLLGFLAVIGLLMQRLASGAISTGAFGAIFYSLNEIYSLMEEVLVSRAAEYNKALPALRAFIQLMNSAHIEEEKERCAPFTDISLENVSFAYPNASQMALNHISFTIHRKDKIAVVGYNGSGKSTLAKLLIGLYSPTEGSITVDRHPGWGPDPRNASVMFQRFNRYKETVFHNIRISEKRDAGSREDRDRRRASEILEQVPLHLSAGEEETLDMLCAREFGGTDLSGGQWQKLAAARMLYRDRSFLVLDEPTAEIDPISEHQMLELFEKELRDKTAVIITHRMAAIRFCNKIIVLRNGEIEAIGDHETLMRTSPLYHALYHSIEERYE